MKKGRWRSANRGEEEEKEKVKKEEEEVTLVVKVLSTETKEVRAAVRGVGA